MGRVDWARIRRATDMLDKGVDQFLTKAGHKQSGSTTEKISDGVRSLFKKVSHDLTWL